MFEGCLLKGEWKMELRVLKYFLVVAREENITKAAKMLHITQPTLSRQLMQMEEEFGVSLFKRSKHSIILTEEGGGLVPVEADRRAAREAAGRLSCLLAARAERVVRVFCGLPLVLKGETL